MVKVVPLALLILSCSKRKKHTNTRINALELYDGPAFRTLRKFLRQKGVTLQVQIVILSAQYGFISESKEIDLYDRRIQRDLVDADLSVYQDQLHRLTRGKFYKRVFVNLGSDYVCALPELPKVIQGTPRITFAHGRIGERVHQMKTWLVDLSVSY